MKSKQSLPHGRQAGGLILNIGIGIVLGLLAALLAVFIVNKGGPFKDRANTNTLTPAAGQSTDPNAPLYGAPAPTLPADPNAKPADPTVSTTGEGTGVLTGNETAVPAAKKQSATKETAKPVETPPADPVAAIISSSDKKPAPAPVKPKANESTTQPAEKKPAAAPTTTKPAESKPSESKPAEAKPAPKEVKPSTLPKSVTPATAP